MTWTLHLGDCLEYLRTLPSGSVDAVVTDPPYIEKAATYVHDFDRTDGSMFGDDHQRLARALARFRKARVVVSYYAHERLGEMYPAASWTHVDCTMTKGIHNAGRRGQTAKQAPEVLIVNGPSFTEALA